MLSAGRIEEAGQAFDRVFELIDRSTPDPRAAARDHRTPGPAPGVFFCAAPIAARAALADRCAARDPPPVPPVLELEPPSERRPSPSRDPPAAHRGPSSAAARCRPGPLHIGSTGRHPASRNRRAAAAGPGARGAVAWAMFQTNNTTVFPTGPNCPIIPLKVAYIFVRGPYDQTRRPVGRGA
jgi:hypothetical protein